MSDTPHDALEGKRRSGTAKRQREKIISVRVHEDEALKIDANAAAVHLCPSAFLRMVGLGAPRPTERRRPNPNMKEVGRLLGECGKLGGNVHQLVRGMNLGTAPWSQEMDAAGKEVRAFFAAVLKALGI